MENKGFALENEAKKRPKTKNTLEVSSKNAEKPEMHAYKRRRGVAEAGCTGPQVGALR